MGDSSMNRSKAEDALREIARDYPDLIHDWALLLLKDEADNPPEEERDGPEPEEIGHPGGHVEVWRGERVGPRRADY